MDFDTPAAYLKHLKSTLRDLWPKPSDGEPKVLHDLIEARTPDAEAHFAERYSESERFSSKPFMDLVQRDIERIYDSGLRERLKNSVAIDFCPIRDANARIFRSQEGHFAIIFNTGLSAFVRSYLGLRNAVDMPNDVSYCSEGDPRSLSPHDYERLIQRMLAAYRERGIKAGLLIVMFSGDTDMHHSVMLLLFTYFIFGHEIGHFDLGHFDDLDNYAACPDDSWRYEYTDSMHHNEEFETNVAGFRLTVTAMKRKWPHIDVDYLFGAPRAFFAMLQSFWQRIHTRREGNDNTPQPTPPHAQVG